MTESKRKRIVVACTVGAVLLVVMLAFVMVYQLISMKIMDNKLSELNSAIAYYEQLIEEGTDTYEARSTLNWIKMRAYELGYEFDEDVGLIKK